MPIDLSTINLAEVIANPGVGVIPALWFIGWMLKNSAVSNRLIPWILAVVGIALAQPFYATSVGYVGAGIIGLLHAAVAVYAHGLVKGAKPGA